MTKELKFTDIATLPKKRIVTKLSKISIPNFGIDQKEKKNHKKKNCKKYHWIQKTFASNLPTAFYLRTQKLQLIASLLFIKNQFLLRIYSHYF